MDKSLDIRKIIYYLLCIAFLVVIVVIGLLNTFILQIQLSSFITDFVYTVLLFTPNFYCCIGQAKVLYIHYI